MPGDLETLLLICTAAFIGAALANVVLALLAGILVIPVEGWTPGDIRRYKRVWLVTALPAPVVILLLVPYPLTDPRGIAAFLASLLPIIPFRLLLNRSWIARNAHWSNSGRCPECSYDMRGHATATRCPECGTDLTDEARDEVAP